MVSVFVSRVVDRVFQSSVVESKTKKMICVASTLKHAALRRKSKDWTVRNQDKMCDSDDMSIRERLFQRAGTIKIRLSVLV